MLWGTVGAAYKHLDQVAPVPPLVAGFLRLAIAAPLLGAWRWQNGGVQTFRFRGADRAWIVALGITNALYQVFYLRAVAQIGVALATLVSICSAPMFVAVVARLVLGERLTRRDLVAVTAGVVGAAMLIGVPRGHENLGGLLTAFVAAMILAAFVVSSRVLASHDHGKIVAVGFGCGAMVLAPFAAVAAAQMEVFTTAAALWLLYMGVVPTAIAYVLYFRGMRTTSATAASALTLVEPLTATVLALLLFHVSMGLDAVIGGVCLVASAGLLATAEQS